MANLITVTTFSSLSQAINGPKEATTATPLVINVKNILAVKTRTNPLNTTGITDVLYELPYNQSKLQVTLVVTEAAAAIVTAANALPA